MREFFSDMMLVRSKGYGPPDYDPHILPFDMTDFVGWHHLFCLKKGKKLIPFGSFKQITLETRDAYRIEFPLEAVAKETHATEHLQAIDELLQQSRTNHQPVIYGGSWSIDKTLRADKVFSQTMREVFAALIALDFIERKAHTALGFGALRFKTDHFFKSLGYDRLKHNGTILPPLVIKHANDEPVVMVKMTELSPWARQCYKKNQFTLRSRIMMGGPLEESTIRKAA